MHYLSADEETDEEDPEVAEPNDNQIKPVDDEDDVDDSESYNGNKDDSRVGKDEEEMNPYERLRASNIEERKRKMEALGIVPRSEARKEWKN